MDEAASKPMLMQLYQKFTQEEIDEQVMVCLAMAEPLVGKIDNAVFALACPMITERFTDFSLDDIAMGCKELMSMEIYGMVTVRHFIQAMERHADKKIDAIEERNQRRKFVENKPFADPKVLDIMKSIGKPKELNLPWGALNADNLMNLEEVSGLSEQEKKNRKWVREWFTERAAWAKETGNRIEDYPVTMESFIEARWVELAKLAE